METPHTDVLFGGLGEEVTSDRKDLQLWFSLSYASWLTMPRVLMEAMPEEWQEKMAELLNQYDEAFPNQPDLGTRVQVIKDGKLTKTPHWLLNYRRPDRGMVNRMRSYDEPFE